MSTAARVPFPQLCRAARLPEPLSEYQFALGISRNWRFDFAWLRQRVALEVEGGAWVQGRHTRGLGFAKDIEKYNEAQILGWIVLRCLPDQLGSTLTFDVIRRALDLRRKEA